MLVLFLKLLLAHVLGDFVFQTSTWIKKRKDHIGYLLGHIVIHGLLLLLAFYPDIQDNKDFIVLILATHLLIDSLKIGWERVFAYKGILLFAIDQLLHIGILTAIVLYKSEYPLLNLVQQVDEIKLLVYTISILFIVFVSPVMMKQFVMKWESESRTYSKQEITLRDAGLIIGVLERLMIVGFIQVDFLAGIGFLLAAKSIFRFGDLANAKDIKFTEYILVGTLASFVLAIGIGFILKAVLNYL